MSKIGTTRFPFINLSKSLERAKMLYDADSRGRVMRVTDAFSIWGYSEKSSGGFQTISALKMYGLLDDHGANDDRKVSLSEAAVRYFHDEREDKQRELLQNFALSPKLVAALWSEWKGPPPIDSLARSELKIDYGLTDQSARSFLNIYKENMLFASLSEIRGTMNDRISNESDDREDADGDGDKDVETPRVKSPVVLVGGERELTSGLLSKTAGFRLIVYGQVGPKEIERLISKLELDREILSDGGES